MKIVQMRSFFWAVFSVIQTEYGEILRISSYSVRMRENTDLRIWILFTQWFLICLHLLTNFSVDVFIKFVLIKQDIYHQKLLDDNICIMNFDQCFQPDGIFRNTYKQTLSVIVYRKYVLH